LNSIRYNQPVALSPSTSTRPVVTTCPTQSYLATRFGVPDEVLASHPHALIGSVPEICDRLEQRRGELGVSYINVAQRSMEAFAPVVARLAGR
jgi:hypothetical protein